MPTSNNLTNQNNNLEDQQSDDEQSVCSSNDFHFQQSSVPFSDSNSTPKTSNDSKNDSGSEKKSLSNESDSPVTLNYSALNKILSAHYKRNDDAKKQHFKQNLDLVLEKPWFKKPLPSTSDTTDYPYLENTQTAITQKDLLRILYSATIFQSKSKIFDIIYKNRIFNEALLVHTNFEEIITLFQRFCQEVFSVAFCEYLFQLDSFKYFYSNSKEKFDNLLKKGNKLKRIKEKPKKEILAYLNNEPYEFTLPLFVLNRTPEEKIQNKTLISVLYDYYCPNDKTEKRTLDFSPFQKTLMELNQKPWFKFKEPLDKAQSNNDDFPYSDNTILSIKLDDLLLALLNANKFKLFSQIREIITNNTVFNKELKDIKNNSKKIIYFFRKLDNNCFTYVFFEYLLNVFDFGFFCFNLEEDQKKEFKELLLGKVNSILTYKRIQNDSANSLKTKIKNVFENNEDKNNSETPHLSKKQKLDPSDSPNNRASAPNPTP